MKLLLKKAMQANSKNKVSVFKTKTAKNMLKTGYKLWNNVKQTATKLIQNERINS
jgi:hypothetical protein